MTTHHSSASTRSPTPSILNGSAGQTPPHVAPTVTASPNPSPDQATSTWSLIDYLLQFFNALVGGLIPSTATADSDTDSISLAEQGASTDPPSDTPNGPENDTDKSYSKAFLSFLSIMFSASLGFLKLAVESRTSATTATAKTWWRIVVEIFIVVAVLLVVGAVAEAGPAFFVPQPRPRGRKIERIAWRKWMKGAANYLAGLSLFLMLAGLGCMASASASNVDTGP